MPRPERPLDDGDGAVLRLAAELRALRERAGTPTYRELSARAHYSEATLSQAAAGHKLPSLPVVLAYAQACGEDPEQWRERWQRAQSELRTGEPVQRAPYVGLAAFGPEDGDLFFGREQLVAELAARLGAQRVVVLVGASGAGKSSLLRAGLIPRLTAPVVVFTPGTHPLEECSIHLTHSIGAEVGQVSEDVRGLHRVLSTAVPEGGEVVLVVDQFEEVFTLCREQAERRLFLQALLTAANAHHSRCRVVLGVRADFYTHCTAFPDLVAALREGQVTIGPMTAQELRAAITGPARRYGYTVENALLGELLTSATDRAGVLPLLSHALLQTWHRRRGNTLTLSGFHDAGGIDRALAETAESVFEQLDARQQHVARSLMLRLTVLGEGTEDTKRRLPREEISHDADATMVLDRLARARLVTLHSQWVEISHEALIRAWPRLRDWLNADRDTLRLHHQLADATGIWHRLDQDPGALYRGVRLELARGWLEHDSGLLTAREKDFLATSIAAHKTETTAARRRDRRLRQLVGVLAVLLLLSAALTATAVHSREEATRQRNIALSQKVAAQAAELRATDPPLAAQLALVAYRQAATPQARGALLSAFSPAHATPLTAHADTVNAVALSRHGHLMATAGRDTTVKLWDVTDPHHPRELATLARHTDFVVAVAFSPDGTVVATGSWDHTVRLWDTATHEEIVTLSGHGEGVTSVAFTSDGALLASGSGDHDVRLWDVSDPTTAAAGPVAVLSENGDVVTSVALDPSGTTLAATVWDGSVRLWNIRDPRAAVRGAQLHGHTAAVLAGAFSPDGQIFASAGADHTVHLWPTAASTATAVPRVLTGHTDAVRALAFSPDGHTLVTGGVDHTVRLWDLTGEQGDPAEPIVLAGHTAAVVSAAFSADGTVLVTSADDHTTRLWDFPGPMLLGHRDSVYTVAVSPAGHLAATAGYDRAVRLWNPVTGAALATLSEHSEAVNSAAFSPDGRTLLTAGADHTARRWDLTDPRHPVGITPLIGHTAAVNSVAVSPDGRTTATAGADRTVRLWDNTDGTHLATLSGHTGSIQSVAFSPDGRTLATAAADHTVRLWDVERRNSTAVLIGHDQAVKSVAFSPDGHALATGGADHTARLWNTDTRSELARLTGHTDTVHSVAFSPDGRTVATAAADHAVRLFTDTGATLATLSGHTDRVYTVTFSPDQHTLLSAGGDRTIRTWDTDPERTAHRICTITAPITPAHWQQHLTDLPHQPPCP